MKMYFDNIGSISDGILSVTSSEAFKCCSNGAVLVDIRKSYETDYKKFKVDNFLLIPKNTLQDDYKKIPTDVEIIIADSTGVSSKKTVLFLQSNGYTNVANLSGGIMDWERNGLPVVTDKNEALAKPYFYDNKPKNFVKTTLVKKDDK